MQDIIIRGAEEHNLKNVNVTIPRNKLTVITGLSGSGKSSLAFDTIYAEGQRRYVESLSAYARLFLDKMNKPKVEHIEGLSPAIAIEQRTAGSNPRSTVATVTEIYDYLRLFYAHVGTAHCPKCGKPLETQTAQQIRDLLLSLPEGPAMMLLSPVVRGRKGEHRDILDKLRKDGFVRVRIDGRIRMLDEEIKPLNKKLKHDIEVVVDRQICGHMDSSRLIDSVELALKTSDGVILLMIEDKEASAMKGERVWREELVSEHLSCEKCGVSFTKLEPRHFSFNSPYGACPVCNGIGSLQVMNPERVIANPEKSLKNGAIPEWHKGMRRVIIYYNHLLKCLAAHYKMPEMLTTPWFKLPKKFQDILLYGSGEEIIDFSFVMRGKSFKMIRPFEGILANLQHRLQDSEFDSVRDRLSKLTMRKACPQCHGARLKQETLAVKIGGLSIYDFNRLGVSSALDFIEHLNLSEEKAKIAHDILKEIRNRLKFLEDVGLGYLTLDRESGTLSGGEAQRIRLATQLGCGLVGVLYILDEPSIGLHQRDNGKLLATLKKLRDIGNTVIVVEHDMETIEEADYVLDLGPGAGVQGGRIVGQGTPAELMKCPESLTGKFLSGEESIPVPEKRCKGSGKMLSIRGARHNNLKNVDVDIPLGAFTCVTGVSGSGKSSLINGILRRALETKFELADALPPGEHDAIVGLDLIDRAIMIDQTPIGRTPRSNPATYVGFFAPIRTLFAELPEAKVRGYGPGRFSFNVKGGRCEACQGDGIRKIEMQFLPDVYVECSECHGRRFNDETLLVTYKKKNIADVLEMTVSEGVGFFKNHTSIYRKLKTLEDVGLGYLTLGQSATTLSGGEAQRIKLAAELSKMPKGNTLYILDEPTTGLHSADIRQLLQVLMRLRDKGSTVLVIEHNLDVIKTADYIIDLGPEGGDNGGRLIAAGTPEEVAMCKDSCTGHFLKKILGK